MEATAEQVTDADRGHAERLVLNDMELFTDFISCHGKRHVDSDRIIRVPQLAPFRVCDAALEQVVHLLLNGDAGDVLLARDELKRRYLKDNAKHIAETAARWSRA